jgi:predicted membrane-bound spermidine synthase
LATLILELTLTRIFSVVFYYHFAFLAISIALFGLGAGGVFSYVVAPRNGNVFARLGLLSACTSVMAVISLVIVLTRTELTNGTLALIYFTSALPFLLAGSVVSLAISETIERVDRVYFFDLLGAAGGCLVLVKFLDIFGGPNTVIVAGVLFAVSSAIWLNLAGNARGRAAAVALALALVVLVVTNSKHGIIDVKFAKGHALTGEQFVKWNSFSRIGLAKDKDSGMETIYIDADASTGIANFDYEHLTADQRRDLFFQGPGFPYRVRPGAKTLIIGPGGGWDVARALSSGSKDITGVEINPIIATTIMRQMYPHFSGDLYTRPEVRIEVEDGRSFVRRSREKYQVLQATLVDTWASTAAGAFALSENNLYTTNAFYDYLSHLTDDGVLAFTRWGFSPPRESLRLISLAKVALTQLGEADHKRHVMVVRENSQAIKGWGARDTVLISRKPFTPEDIARAHAAIAESHMEAVYLPDVKITNPFTELLYSEKPEEFYKNYAYDVSPVSDNRPFFFYTVQPRDLVNFVRHESESADYKINRAVPLLFGLVAVSVIATLVILILPPLVLGSRLPTEPGVRKFLWYFVCIGTGYILIQVALIQKFVMLLGHPTYALTVIIFSMLISSGMGSFLSRKVLAGSEERLSYALLLIAGLVAILAFSAQYVADAAITWPLWLKFITTALLIAPAGFMMGMPFPTGLTRLEKRHKPSVRWAWALNAASSVLGSASAIFLAIYLGLRETLLIGGFMYVLAFLVVRVTRPSHN